MQFCCFFETIEINQNKITMKRKNYRKQKNEGFAKFCTASTRPITWHFAKFNPVHVTLRPFHDILGPPLSLPRTTSIVPIQSLIPPAPHPSNEMAPPRAARRHPQ